jgi:hypothetical protein
MRLIAAEEVKSFTLTANVVQHSGDRESGRFRGVRFGAVRVGLGKLLACLNLPYRPLRFINFA